MKLVSFLLYILVRVRGLLKIRRKVNGSFSERRRAMCVDVSPWSDNFEQCNRVRCAYSIFRI